MSQARRGAKAGWSSGVLARFMIWRPQVQILHPLRKTWGPPRNVRLRCPLVNPLVVADKPPGPERDDVYFERGSIVNQASASHLPSVLEGYDDDDRVTVAVSTSGGFHLSAINVAADVAYIEDGSLRLNNEGDGPWSVIDLKSIATIVVTKL